LNLTHLLKKAFSRKNIYFNKSYLKLYTKIQYNSNEGVIYWLWFKP